MIMATSLHVDWAGRRWELLPDKAAVLPESRTVLVTDLHLGKGDHFRAAGVPVPDATDDATLDRLARVCEAAAAESLVILGDFFHARGGVTDALIRRLAVWRERVAFLDVYNVRGNHDRAAGDPPAHLDIECLTGPVDDDGVFYAHEPEPKEDGFVLAGHVHPAVVMGDRADRLRMPCFWFADRVALLPAFGTFTGSKAIRPRPGDRVFAVGPGRVADVSQAVAPVSAG